MDLESGTLHRHDGDVLLLTPLELEVLRYLAARTGQVVTLEELYREVWGYSERVSSRAIDKTASRLRKKMERDRSSPVHLLRVPGRGLRFVPLHADAPRTLTPSSGGLVGRAEELASLEAAYLTHRVITITGPGGIGKTCLARHSLRHTRHFPGGVLSLSLERATHGRDFLVQIARALSLPATSPGLEASLPLAIDARGPCIFLIDSPETVLEEVRASIAQLADATTQCVFLLCSRIPLRIPREWVLRLAGLPTEAACLLFRQQAQHAASSPAEESPALTTLVEALDGNPLAIELAAARANLLTVEQLVSQLGDRFRLLRSRTGSSQSSRHHSLQATIAWSWELLTDDERAACCAAATFAAPFTLQAATAVFLQGEAVWSGDLLQQLLNCSLIRAVDGPERRFVLEGSVRAFVVERQRAQSHSDTVSHDVFAPRLARYFAEIVRPSLPHVNPGRVPDRATWSPDIENLIVGASQDAEPEAAGLCCQAAIEVLRWQGPLASAQELVHAFLARTAPSSPQAVRLLLLQAVLVRHRGQSGEAEAFATRALTLLETMDRPMDQSSALLVLGLARIERGMTAEALEPLQRAHEIRTALGAAPAERAATLSNLGYLQLLLGDTGKAREAYEEALRLFQASGDAIGEGAVLDKLCNLHWTVGDLERSRWYGQRACTIHRDTGNQMFEGIALGNLGTLCQELGEPGAALDYFERARTIHHRLGNRTGLCVVTTYLGALAATRADWEEAAQHFESAHRIAIQLGSDPLEARVLTEWGAMAYASGNLDVAEELLTRAGPRARDRNRAGMVLALRGLIAAERDEHAFAHKALAEVQETAAALKVRNSSRLGKLVLALESACDQIR